MKKILAILLITVILVSTSSIIVTSKTIEKKSDIIALGPHIIIPDHFPTIQEGIDNANPGEVIFVRSGIYKENISIDKEGLHILGESKYTTIIDGDKTKEDAVTISAKNVTIQEFTITNAYIKDTLVWHQSGVKIFSANANINNNRFISNRIGIHTYKDAYNLTISNNEFIDDGILLADYFNYDTYPELTQQDYLHTITDNTVNGMPLYYYTHQNDFTVPDDAGQIILVNCTNVTIEDMYMTHNDFSITLAFCSNCLIQNVTISDTNGEILIEHSENNTIQNNTISNTLKAICLESDSKNNIVRYNDVSYNYVGLSIFTCSSDNEIYCNSVHNNDGAGIEIISLHGGVQQRNIISKNHIYKNKYGMHITYNSCNNTINNNTLSNNKIGIVLAYSSNNNTFEHNTFKKTIIPAIFLGCTKNTWYHNFWNRPRILPKVIYGYRTIDNLPIPWINIDRNPSRDVQI